MTLPHTEWRAKGFRILLVQAKDNYYHALVSPDGIWYSIYDRFGAPSLQHARDHYHFDPSAFYIIEAPWPITKERALCGETGIPPIAEPLMKEVEELPYLELERIAQQIQEPGQPKCG